MSFYGAPSDATYYHPAKPTIIASHLSHRYMKWMMRVNWKTLGYMIREELQRDKLKVRAGRRTEI